MQADAESDASMTPESLSCPYCNARITLSPADAGSARLRCPRCGDTFPHRPASPASVNGTPAPPAEAAVPAPELLPPGRWSNAAVVRAVLGVMAGMAVLGLAYALWTQQFRR